MRTFTIEFPLGSNFIKGLTEELKAMGLHVVSNPRYWEQDAAGIIVFRSSDEGRRVAAAVRLAMINDDSGLDSLRRDGGEIAWISSDWKHWDPEYAADELADALKIELRWHEFCSTKKVHPMDKTKHFWSTVYEITLEQR